MKNYDFELIFTKRFRTIGGRYFSGFEKVIFWLNLCKHFSKILRLHRFIKFWGWKVRNYKIDVFFYK